MSRETPLKQEGIRLAELGVGDTFGEEALIAEAKRNATVTMLTDGVLMRLKKEDFRELMTEPLLQWVNREQASAIVAKGGRWLDVRLPSEHQTLAVEGALNIPLYLIRLKLSTLDPAVPYVVYCDTGRRSSAAAYLLVERGFDAYVLTGGLSNGSAAAAPAKAPPAPRAAPAPKAPGAKERSPESASARRTGRESPRWGNGLTRPSPRPCLDPPMPRAGALQIALR